MDTIHPVTQEQRVAEDKLDAMIELKKDLRRFFNKAREQARTAGVSAAAWVNTAEIIEEAIDEMLSWHENEQISGRVDYPVKIPSALSFNVRSTPVETTIGEDMNELGLRIQYAGYLRTNKSACLNFEEWKEGRA